MKSVPSPPVLVILAAGKSERMGFPKGLMDLKGTPLLLAHQLAFRELGGNEVIIVSSVYFQEYDHLAKEALHLKNPDPSRGPFSSLLCALSHIKNQDVLMAPVDSHPITPEVFKKLSQGLRSAKASVPTYQGKGGHPVLLSNALVKELQTLSPTETRLNEVLKKLGPEVARVEVDSMLILENYNLPS